MPVNRLELLRQLAAMPEGIETLDAMLASFTGRGVDRRVVTLCRNPKVRFLSLEYIETLRAAVRRSRA
jgi:hypothetical protein